MRAQYRIIDLPKHGDHRGTLTFAQTGDHIPFTPVRIFMLYGMGEGAERGDHAHRTQHQYVIMMHGSANIEIDDGHDRTAVTLDTPSRVLHVPPMLWLRLKFSASAACAVLASGHYDEADYIRDYREFLELTGNGTGG